MSKIPHVFVVDDEEMVTRVVKRTLEQEGYTVSDFNNGYAALAAITTTRPDLIILDINMPDINGYQTLERVKQKYTDIPVIMLTAVQDAASVNRSINLGADDYIRKPFRPRELQARIKAKLRRSGVLTDDQTHP